MHYGLNSPILVFHMLLLIRHSVARGRKLSDRAAKIQSQCIPLHRTLLIAQLDPHCPRDISGHKITIKPATVLGKDLIACKAAPLAIGEPCQQLCLQSPTPAVPTCTYQPKKGFSLPSPAQHHPRGMHGERCEPQQPPGFGIKSEPRFAAHRSLWQRGTIPGLRTSHLLLLPEGTMIKLYVLKHHKLHPVTSSCSMPSPCAHQPGHMCSPRTAKPQHRAGRRQQTNHLTQEHPH